MIGVALTLAFASGVMGTPVARLEDRVVGGDLVIAAGERARTVVTLGGSITLEAGAEARSATALGGSIILLPGARVDRDAVALGGSIRIGEGATVGGNATSLGGAVDVAPGGQVERDRVSVGLPLPSVSTPTALALAGAVLGAGAILSPLLIVASALSHFVVFFAVGLLFLALWPRRLERLTQELGQRPDLSVLMGVGALFALPLLGLLLVITLVGIPLALFELLAVAVASAAGFSALALALGRRLPVGAGSPASQLALGTLLLTVVMAVPVFGPLAGFCAWLWIFGAAVRSRLGAPPESSATPAPPTAI